MNVYSKWLKVDFFYKKMAKPKHKKKLEFVLHLTFKNG